MSVSGSGAIKSGTKATVSNGREAMAKAGSQSPVNGAGVGGTPVPRPEDLGYRKGMRPGFPGLKTWATEKE